MAEEPVHSFKSTSSDVGGNPMTLSLLIATALASLGSFNFGYNLSAVNAPAITFKTCPPDALIWDCFNVSLRKWGFVAGIMCAGALLGSFMGGNFTDRLGRKNAILSSNIPYIIGFLFLTFSNAFWMLIVGRIFVGIGIGITCITVPIYLTEISTTKNRGIIGSAHQMGVVVGFLAAEVFSYLGLYKMFYWRILFGFAIVPCILQIFGMLWQNLESPRYLAQKNDINKARNTLCILRKESFSEKELEEMVASSTNSNDSQRWSLADLLWRRRSEAGKSMLIAASLHLGQQLSGINSILLFSSSIFGTGTETLSTVPLLIASLNLLMTILAIAVIDRAGRRLLAITSSAGMLISSLTLTAAFIFDHRLISIASVLIFVGSFAFGMGPIPWLMTNELFPTDAVGPAVTFAVALNWTSNMIVTVSFPTLRELLANYTMLPYSSFILIFLVFSALCLPETKGRHLGFV